MVIFAKSRAGKSYAVTLEILRSLMLGKEVIVIDPENEYHLGTPILCQPKLTDKIINKEIPANIIYEDNLV